MILIPVAVAIAWLGVLGLCLSICVMAARGDAAYERESEESPPATAYERAAVEAARAERRAAAAAETISSPRPAESSLRLRRVRRASPRTLTGRAVR